MWQAGRTGCPEISGNPRRPLMDTPGTSTGTLRHWGHGENQVCGSTGRGGRNRCAEPSHSQKHIHVHTWAFLPIAFHFVLNYTLNRIAAAITLWPKKGRDERSCGRSGALK